MATVHYGRLLGPVGFSRTVAIKRLHPQFAKDPEFAAMFLDEARVAARIRHPNVVQTLDVVALDGELFLVMDYVQGESLGRLIRASSAKREFLPLDIVSSIVCGVLHGLHAAHEATNEAGDPLGIVHRDVSPQNVLVGADGVPRVLDFGVAKAAGRMQTTREGQLKGKLAYMSPEQLRAQPVDRRTDVYAAGVVLWETLVLKHLFSAESEGGVVTKVLEEPITPPSAFVAGIPASVDGVVLRALDRQASQRFESARQMALALEAAVPIASPTRVVAWLQGLVGELLAERAKSVALVEKDSGSGMSPIPLGGSSDLVNVETKITGSGVRQPPTRASSPPVPLGEASRPGPSGPALGVSQSTVSSISVSTHAVAQQLAPRRSPLPIVLGIGGLAVGAIAVAALFLRRPPEPTPLRATEPAAATAPTSSIAAPVEPPPSTVSAPVASVPSVPPVSVASAASAESAVTPDATKPAMTVRHPSKTTQVTGAPKSTPSAPQTAAAAPQEPSPAPSCTLRSYLDESGIKHFSKECK
jgi:eukaryotic-like serine/threonine-protein kinase